MSTIQKWIAALIVTVAIAGAYFFPQSQTIIQQLAGASPAGTTGQTAKLFTVVANLSAPGANATSSSILNTSANDYYINAIKAGCEVVGTSRTAYTGAALAALTLTVSTTTTSAPAAAGANIVGSTAMTLGTSTPQFVEASSTASNGATTPGSALVNNIWASGSYLTFQTNATNTAQCTFGVEAFSS